MQTIFYLLASIAAVMVIVAVPVMMIRTLVFIARLEDTRRNLANLINESSLSLQQANRVLAHTQEAVDHLRHTIERIEGLLTILQPATAVASLIAGAKRAITGHHSPTTATVKSE